ncbi:MAG: SMC-Scp complex subunit ScpB [Candidatus Vogelbacteria bacterium]|nr:SMC-Scp complex subunit ScpB [Candidatus Vogelbacteria bacterium]
MVLELEEKLEALLFWKAEPQRVSKLAETLAVGESEIKTGLEGLTAKLSDRGVRLVVKDDEVTLGTAPELGDLLTRLTKEELSADLGRAGLETLTVVLYRGPVAKSEIDYLRGVNSSFTLRHLLVRGLIEKKSNPNDARSSFYQPTFESMSLLGLVRLDELPEYEAVKKQIDDFLQTNQ